MTEPKLFRFCSPPHEVVKYYVIPSERAHVPPSALFVFRWCPNDCFRIYRRRNFLELYDKIQIMFEFQYDAFYYIEVTIEAICCLFLIFW